MCGSVGGVMASGQAEGSLGGWGATEVAMGGRDGMDQEPAGGKGASRRVGVKWLWA